MTVYSFITKAWKRRSLEGYLMPETYAFYWQTDEREIIERMLEGFKQFL